MKKIKFVFIPIILGFVIYIMSPNNFFLSNTIDTKSAKYHIEKLLKKNESDPLRISFEKLLSRIPSLESNYVNLLIYYHDLWLKNNCNPICSDKKIKEKIEFYDKQPIQHSLFQSVIFQKDILIPYSNKSLKDCIEYDDCNRNIGEHNISFEITFSKVNTMLSETINEVIIENRDILFSKYIDGHFYQKIDSDVEQKIEIFFDKIITIKKHDSSYTHGAARANGWTKTKHFNISKNRLLQFHDVFKKNIIPKLSKTVFDRIKEGYKIPPNMMNPIEKTVSNINLWNFTNKGFYLYLPPYEESSWMATSRDFTFEEMNQFLTPFGKSLR